MRQDGFTLVELLVVLAILAVLTTIAARSLTGLQDRKRRDATISQLAEIEGAILDRRGGFLNDVGRLPDRLTVPELSELWENPGLASSHLATDSIDPGVTLAVGWRGPYLTRAPGDDRLRDGFGNELFVEDAPADGSFRVVALGADGASGGREYDADLDIVFQEPLAGIDRASAEVTGQVEVEAEIPATWIERHEVSILVVAFGPDPSDGELRATQTNATVLDLEQEPLVFQYTIPASAGLTPGRRLLRAYLYHAATAPSPRTLGSGRSAVRTVDLLPGAQNIDLTIESLDPSATD